MTRVLTGATLIDGTGAAPVSDAAVVIDGDRIVAAGPRAGMTWPPDASVVDVSGRTVIPGLIDAHDHMASHGYALATRWGWTSRPAPRTCAPRACSPRRSPWGTRPSATPAGSTRGSRSPSSRG